MRNFISERLFDCSNRQNCFRFSFTFKVRFLLDEVLWTRFSFRIAITLWKGGTRTIFQPKQTAKSQRTGVPLESLRTHYLEVKALERNTWLTCTAHYFASCGFSSIAFWNISSDTKRSPIGINSSRSPCGDWLRNCSNSHGQEISESIKERITCTAHYSAAFCGFSSIAFWSCFFASGGMSNLSIFANRRPCADWLRNCSNSHVQEIGRMHQRKRHSHSILFRLLRFQLDGPLKLLLWFFEVTHLFQ